jgi:hypothetical protein
MQIKSLFLMQALLASNANASERVGEIDYSCAKVIATVVEYLNDDSELTIIGLSREKINKESYVLSCGIPSSDSTTGVILRKKGLWQSFGNYLFKYKYPTLLSVRYGRGDTLTRDLSKWHSK